MDVTCNIFIYQMDTSNDKEMLIYNKFLSELKTIKDNIHDEIDDFDVTIEIDVKQMKDVSKIVKLLQKYQKSFKKIDDSISVGVDMRF